MSALLSIIFGIWGIVWIFAGKPFIEVAACFLVCAIFEGSWELYLIRKEFEDDEEEE